MLDIYFRSSYKAADFPIEKFIPYFGYETVNSIPESISIKNSANKEQTQFSYLQLPKAGSEIVMSIRTNNGQAWKYLYRTTSNTEFWGLTTDITKGEVWDN